MSTLTLELSDEQLWILEHLAQQQERSVNALVIALINDLAERSEPHNVYEVTQDPLYNITSHDTRVPADLSQHADHRPYGAKKR